MADGMKAIVRFHKGLIASAVGLFSFLIFWSLRIAAPPRPGLAAICGVGAVSLLAYYVLVVRKRYG